MQTSGVEPGHANAHDFLGEETQDASSVVRAALSTDELASSSEIVAVEQLVSEDGQGKEAAASFAEDAMLGEDKIPGKNSF